MFMLPILATIKSVPSAVLTLLILMHGVYDTTKIEKMESYDQLRESHISMKVRVS